MMEKASYGQRDLMMEMSNREIAYSYRTAAYPKKQIPILADLNCTSRAEIEDILRSEGIDIPVKKKKRKKKEDEEMGETKEEASRQKMPETVARILFKRLDELETIIKGATEEYKELAKFMEGAEI